LVGDEPRFQEPGPATAGGVLGKGRGRSGGKRLRRFEAQTSPKGFQFNTVRRSWFLPVQNSRFNSSKVCRRSQPTLVKRHVPSTPENRIATPAPVLHFVTLQNARGKYLQFQSFDEAYVTRLRAGDPRTQEHFSAYFTALIKIKLSSRLKSPEATEDVRQETFARFFVALRDGKILQPDRLGAFVNSICNNVLLEHYRSGSRNSSLDDEEEDNFPALNVDLVGALTAQEREKKVRQILEKISERDRRLLREVFLEERDKDQVCRDFGVDREYLRVLLHRAKQAFKASYLKHSGDNPPDFASA